MAEEKTSFNTQDLIPTLDDVSALRVLLYTVKGISSVSTINASTTYEDSTV